jgi:hypothetical protein
MATDILDIDAKSNREGIVEKRNVLTVRERCITHTVLLQSALTPVKHQP